MKFDFFLNSRQFKNEVEKYKHDNINYVTCNLYVNGRCHFRYPSSYTSVEISFIIIIIIIYLQIIKSFFSLGVLIKISTITTATTTTKKHQNIINFCINM